MVPIDPPPSWFGMDSVLYARFIRAPNPRFSARRKFRGVGLFAPRARHHLRRRVKLRVIYYIEQYIIYRLVFD